MRIFQNIFFKDQDKINFEQNFTLITNNFFYIVI